MEQHFLNDSKICFHRTNQIVLEVTNDIGKAKMMYLNPERSEKSNMPRDFPISFLTCESSFRLTMTLTLMAVASTVAAVTVAGVRTRW